MILLYPAQDEAIRSRLKPPSTADIRPFVNLGEEYKVKKSMYVQYKVKKSMYIQYKVKKYMHVQYEVKKAMYTKVL
jgi:hypothetical protein